MKKRLMKLVRVIRGEEGASLVEYGLLVGLIAVACVAVIGTLGTTVQGGFQAIIDAIATAGGFTP